MHMDLFSQRLRSSELAQRERQAPATLPDEEKADYVRRQRLAATGFGYLIEQVNRPETIGHSLADSPVGLALVDRSRRCGRPAGRGSRLGSDSARASATGELTRDEILDNITLYWLTNTGVSASRLIGNTRVDSSTPRASPSRSP